MCTPSCADMYSFLGGSVLLAVMIYLIFVLEDVESIDDHSPRLAQWWRLFQWYIHGALGLMVTGTVFFGYCNAMVMRIIYTDYETVFLYESTDYSTWKNVQSLQFLMILASGVAALLLTIAWQIWRFNTAELRAKELRDKKSNSETEPKLLPEGSIQMSVSNAQCSPSI